MAKDGKNSLLSQYEPGEIIFNIRDKADSLFIIQKGQIRLFVPKGKGFVDLAILRSGEVIGEMAYFYEDAKVRSCSAVAVNKVELIEIPFTKFDKTIQGLNPWFKVIVNTLADRVRASNEKIKALESDSVGYHKGKRGEYSYFQNIDIVRALAHIYMILKAQGTVNGSLHKLEENKLKTFIVDIFGFKDTKFEEFIYLLESEGFLKKEAIPDEKGSFILVEDIDLLRKLFAFFNTQRLTEDKKKIIISYKCEEFLSRVLQKSMGSSDETMVIELNPILEEFKKEKFLFEVSDLEDAIKNKILDDPISDPDGKGLIVTANLERLNSLWPCISLTNAISRFNSSKRPKDY